jgi:6-pyruvoyltetrahydropterin/6-carboxytetrahydropterin synthase
MTTTVVRRYHAECAHWLPGVPETHKCHRVHGHNYEFEIEVWGEPDQRGFVLDFAELDALVNPIIARIDHRLLNDIAGLENPTAELIAKWIDQELSRTSKFFVRRVTCYETKDCWANYLTDRAPF